MNRILRKDPIVEARCAFQFASPDWDWTVPGLLWGQLREEFPLKQQFDLVASDTPLDSDETMGVSQLNFWRADKTALVRTQPNELGIIQRAPYVGWPSFKATIKRVLKTYREIAPTSELEGISLSYMNRLPLPAEDKTFDVRQYLSVLPSIPDDIEYSSVGRWLQQTEILKLQEQILLTFRVGFINEEKTARLVAFIDINAEQSLNRVKDGAELEWLETAHKEIEELFFACLKQPYLDILEMEENRDENVNT